VTDDHASRRPRVFAEASLALSIAALASVFLYVALPTYDEIPVLGLMVAGPLAILSGVYSLTRVPGREHKIVARLGVTMATLLVIGACLIPVNPRARGAARRAQFTNNLKQVGLALHNYQAVYHRLPPAVVRDRDGKPLYSWRVLILPYAEASPLYHQFHLDEPWDSPHNRTLLAQRPGVYSPLGDVGSAPGETFIEAFVGPRTAFDSPEGEPFDLPRPELATAMPAFGSNFPDGMANTILVVEARHPIPWSAPEDIPFGPGLPIPHLGGAVEGNRPWFRRRAPIDSFAFLLADGSVNHLPTTTPQSRLRALVTRNGGEASPPDGPP
jgi:hypothetical protein